jgi:hypothetical protein
MSKQKILGAILGASVLFTGGALAQQAVGPDNAWLQGVMKGMEMMGGKMKGSTMADAKGMTMSKPAMVIIDLKTGRMMQIDAAEAQKYFPVTP